MKSYDKLDVNTFLYVVDKICTNGIILSVSSDELQYFKRLLKRRG